MPHAPLRLRRLAVIVALAAAFAALLVPSVPAHAATAPPPGIADLLPQTPPPGTGDIPTSAGQLARFVDAVLAATGAAKVALVGHSQGGMMPRWYLKFLGGAAKVDDLVGLAPSNHGTTNPGALITGATFCPACLQQRAGSSFLRALNAGDETPGDVSYTVVETSHDEVVTPFTSAFLAAGPNTVNILLQDHCPADPTHPPAC